MKNTSTILFPFIVSVANFVLLFPPFIFIHFTLYLHLYLWFHFIYVYLWFHFICSLIVALLFIYIFMSIPSLQKEKLNTRWNKSCDQDELLLTWLRKCKDELPPYEDNFRNMISTRGNKGKSPPDANNVKVKHFTKGIYTWITTGGGKSRQYELLQMEYNCNSPPPGRVQISELHAIAPLSKWQNNYEIPSFYKQHFNNEMKSFSFTVVSHTPKHQINVIFIIFGARNDCTWSKFNQNHHLNYGNMSSSFPDIPHLPKTPNACHFKEFPSPKC